MARSATFDAIIRLKDQASKELSKIETNLANHEKAWKRTGYNIKKTFKGISDTGQNMTTRLTLPLAAAGVAGFSFAADLEDAMGASEQIFKSQAGAMQTWADNLPSYYGIAEKEALTYGNTMGAMFKNIGGLSEEQAAQQTQKLIELAGDASAMFGGSVGDAMYAFQAALKGNNTMLDNYGMGVNDATIKSKALEMGLKSAGGQLSLADKQAATVALIMEQMADAEGQAAREADGASGSTKSFKSDITNLATEIGQVLLPIVTPMIQKAGEWVKRFGELSDSQKRNIVIIAGIVAAIGPLLVIIGQLGMGVGGVLMFMSTLPAIIGGVGAAFAFLTGPIGLTIAAIAAGIAIGLTLVKNWDKIKEKGIEVTTAVSDIWNTAVTGIQDGFQMAKDSLINTGNQLKDGLINAFNMVKSAIKEGLLFPLEKAMDLAKAFSQTKIGQKVIGGVENITGLNIGSNADGTSHWRGGLTTINEKGGEIIDLQRGARVYPHDKSVQMAYADGQKSAGGGTISVNFDGAIFHVREEADINRIGKNVAQRLQFAAMNRGKVY